MGLGGPKEMTKMIKVFGQSLTARLRKAELESVDDVLAFLDDGLGDLPGIGEKTVAAVEKAVEAYARELVGQVAEGCRGLGVIPISIVANRTAAEAALVVDDWAGAVEYAQLALLELSPKQVDQICKTCGAINVEGAKVCGTCGADPNEVPEVPVPEPPATVEVTADEPAEVEAEAAVEVAEAKAGNPGDPEPKMGCERCTFKGAAPYTVSERAGDGSFRACLFCAQAHVQVPGLAAVYTVTPSPERIWTCRCGQPVDRLNKRGLHLSRKCSACAAKQSAVNGAKARKSEAPVGADREVGTVKWFNDRKGFGFIARDGNDLFVHYTEVHGEGFRSLREGQRVEFTVEQTSKGLQATGVVVLHDDGEAEKPVKAPADKPKANAPKPGAQKPRKRTRAPAGPPGAVVWTDAATTAAEAQAAKNAADVLKGVKGYAAHIQEDTEVAELVTAAKQAIEAGNGRQARRLAVRALARASELDRPRREAEKAKAKAEKEARFAAERARKIKLNHELAARKAKREAEEKRVRLAAEAAAEAKALEELQARVYSLDREFEIQTRRIRGLPENESTFSLAFHVATLKDWAERLFGSPEGWATWTSSGSMPEGAEEFVGALNRVDSDLRRAAKAVKKAKRRGAGSHRSDADGQRRPRTPYVRDNRRSAFDSWAAGQNLPLADVSTHYAGSAV